jgi:phosphoglycolate phosphatase
MIDCLLFDFDGTLFDTLEGITKSVQYAVNKRGLHPALDSLRCFAGPPLVDMFMEHFGFDRDTALQAVAAFRERYKPIGLYECRVFPGIRELLIKLKQAGYRIGVATSKPQVLAEELLEREDMLSLFDALVGSSPDKSNDSKADVLRRAMDALGSTAAQTVLIGDTKYDVAGAKQCNMSCVGVGWGYAAEGELEAAGAACIVLDIPTLEKLLLHKPFEINI